VKSEAEGPDQDKALTYTINEVAKLLQISRNAAYEAARTGSIPSVRIGRTIRVPRHALEERLAAVA
jgi:excisionase family DNA binding protein